MSLKLIAALAVIVSIYAGACALMPYTNCFRCGGKGWHFGMIRRRRVRDCWWCDACGQRLRAGRRIYNHVVRLRREGQARKTDRMAGR